MGKIVLPISEKLNKIPQKFQFITITISLLIAVTLTG